MNSDEVGDDCERDSDLMETDGSDDGEDLLDFIVSDNRPVSSLPISSMQEPRSTSPTTISPAPTPRGRTEKPFFVPTPFPGTQDSEGIPDLDTLVGTKAGSRLRSAEQDSDEDVTARRTGRGRRAVVDDSDSDF